MIGLQAPLVPTLLLSGGGLAASERSRPHSYVPEAARIGNFSCDGSFAITWIRIICILNQTQPSNVVSELAPALRVL